MLHRVTYMGIWFNIRAYGIGMAYGGNRALTMAVQPDGVMSSSKIYRGLRGFTRARSVQRHRVQCPPKQVT